MDVQQLLGEARISLENKEYGKVLDACSLLLRAEPNYPDAIALQAAALAESGEWELGFEKLKKALDGAPNDPVLLLALSAAFRRERKFEDARSIVGRLLSLNPRNPEALALSAFCLIDQRQYQRALPVLEQAIALTPNVANYHQKLGMIHQGLRNFPNAAVSYDKSLELDPSNPSSYANLSQVLFELKDYERAITLMEKAVSLKPDSAEYYVLLARAFIGADRKEGIEKLLEKAVELKETFYVAHSMLGYRYLELGRFEPAERHMRRSLALRPGQARLYEVIAVSRKLSVADAPLKEEMESYLGQPSLPPDQKRHLVYALGKYHNDVGEYDAAFRLFDEGNALMKASSSKNRPFNRKLFSHILDGFIETFDEKYFERSRELGSLSEKPVLIVGVIRSGTTMLEEILGRHNRIGPGGELPFWHQNLTGVRNQEVGLVSAEQADLLKRGYLKALQKVAPGCDRVIDKMPQNFMLLGWIHALFPKAKIIVCRRQPVDIALSIWMTPFRDAIDFAHDKKNIIYYMTEFNRLIEHWKSVIPDDLVTEVWYEKVVADQESEIKRLVKFLDLEWDSACLEGSTAERAIETPSLWQARQKVYNTSVERWRNYEPWLGDFRELLNEAGDQNS